MDPVSRVVEKRTGKTPSLGPYILAAVMLHLAVAAAVIVVAKRGPSRVVHFPSVSVRLVQLPRPRRRGHRAAAQPTAAPQPTARPEPSAAPKPTAAPKPPRAEHAAASKDAMADLHPTARPTPRRAAPAESGPRGHGLALAGKESGGQPAIPEDFRFAYYVNRMLALIESHWYKPPAPPGTTARVRFVIRSDGRLEGIALEASSGVPSFDRAALRALYAANPLPPLPPAYRKPSLTVHLAFTE